MAAGSSSGEVIKKKGRWSGEEDEKLMSYMKEHAGHEGRRVLWAEVPRLAGLNRCRKSCWLRWSKYLAPHIIKKGKFSQEEEATIIALQARYGNKWALISRHLQGRTDNEIKNFWNTRLNNKSKSKSTKKKNVEDFDLHSSSTSSAASLTPILLHPVIADHADFPTSSTYAVTWPPSSDANINIIPPPPPHHHHWQQHPLHSFRPLVTPKSQEPHPHGLDPRHPAMEYSTLDNYLFNAGSVPASMDSVLLPERSDHFSAIPDAQLPLLNPHPAPQGILGYVFPNPHEALPTTTLPSQAQYRFNFDDFGFSSTINPNYQTLPATLHNLPARANQVVEETGTNIGWYPWTDCDITTTDTLEGDHLSGYAPLSPSWPSM